MSKDNKFIIRKYNVTNNILTLDRILNARMATLASPLVTACVFYRLSIPFSGDVRIFHYI